MITQVRRRRRPTVLEPPGAIWLSVVLDDLLPATPALGDDPERVLHVPAGGH
jgi:hypothetical protein